MFFNRHDTLFITLYFIVFFCFIAEILTSFAVRQSFLQEERIVTEKFATISAVEALRVEVLSNRVQAILYIKMKKIINTSNHSR